MKLTLNKTTFQKAMMIGSQFAGRSKALPILNSVKIDVKDGRLTISSSDGENTIKTAIDGFTCDCNQISFCIDAKDSSNYIKQIRDNEFSFISDDMNMVTIKHSKGKAKFPLSKSEEFVDVKLESDLINFTMESSVLYNWIVSGRNFVGSDELRPVLNGIYLYAKNGEFGYCATDGSKLITDNIEDVENNNFEFILNKNSFTPLLSLLNNDSDVTFRIGSRNVLVICGQTKLLIRLIEGRFPNFKSVIPQNQPIQVGVDKKALLDSISRVNVGGDKIKGLIKLNVSNNNMNLSSQDIDFSTEADEDIECTSNDNIVIGLKYDSLVCCLSTISNDNVVLEMKSYDTACTFKDSDSPKKTLLLMPMLLS